MVEILQDPPLTDLVQVLSVYGLPTADLNNLENAKFFSCVDGHDLLGVIGLEKHGSFGLLRSLAVNVESQGKGVGEALLKALENHAKRSDISQLYLLTESAEGFFRAYGYTEISRDAAPDQIQDTEQFSNLCPDSAKLMYKLVRG